jgi:hypothetical protein
VVNPIMPVRVSLLWLMMPLVASLHALAPDDSWHVLEKPGCSHFCLCAANGFVELSPGKQPDRKTADAAAMANDDGQAPGNLRLTLHRANRWRRSLQPTCVEPLPAAHRRTAGAPCPTAAARRRGHRGALGYSTGSQALNAHRRGMGHVIFRQRRAPKRPFQKINYRGLLAAGPGRRPA